MLRVAVLGDHQHRAAPFAADREALDDAKDDQSNGRPYADAVVARHDPDQDGCEAHHHEAPHQQFLAADAVAEMAEDDAAERPRDEADGVGGEGEQGADQRVERGEEQLVEDEGGGGAVEEEVVPLDGGADQAGEDDAAKTARSL